MPCRRQVLVRLERIAAVWPPRSLPTNKEFFRLAPALPHDPLRECPNSCGIFLNYDKEAPTRRFNLHIFLLAARQVVDRVVDLFAG
jgi:hypothetical protein